MAKRGRKKKALISKQLWERANTSHRAKWQSDAQKAYDFYLNDQLTKDEKDSLEESGMPTFVINRITPVIEVMKYFATANNPKWQAVGVEGSDVDIAAVHSSIAEYCWQLSGGKSLYASVILDALVRGIGYFFIDVDADSDHGMGDVVFRSIDPFDVYVDPMSRDPLFKDATYIIIKKNLPKSQLKSIFPEYSRKIQKASSQNASTLTYSVRDSADSSSIQSGDMGNQDSYTIEGEEDDILDYYEVYSKKKVHYVNAYIQVVPTQVEMEQIRNQVQEELEMFIKETEVSLAEQITKLQMALQEGEIIEERATLEIEKAQKDAERAIEEHRIFMENEAVKAQTKIEQLLILKDGFDELLKDPNYARTVVDFVDFFETRIDVSISAGDTHLFEQELPYTEYPIVPIPYSHTGTPYPMSAVTPLVGKQQEINKAHQIMLHNANLASNLRWLYEEGSIPEEEWEQYASSPGALLKFRQGFTPPTPIQPLGLNNAFFSIVQEGKGDLEYISGVSSAMQGVGAQTHETYRGLLALDEYGTRRIRAWMISIVEPALEHLGKVFKEIAQQIYTHQKVFRIVQPEAGGIEGEKEVKINIPIYNDYGQVIKKWNDYASAKFDIFIISGATAPTNRWAVIDEYFRWFQAGLIDDIAMLAETDIRDKKSIIERKSLYAQQQQQIEQLSGALEDAEGTIDTLERQVVQSNIKTRVAQAETEISKDKEALKGEAKDAVRQTQAEQRLLRDVMRQRAKEQTKE